MSPGLPLLTTEILASLAEHRVLSTPQVRTIHLPGRGLRRTQQVLARLARAGLIDAVASNGAGVPRRLWFATERGARIALEVGALEAMPRLTDAESAAGPLQAHTLAVNEAAIAFLEAARERGEDFGPLSWRHEVPFRLGPTRKAGSLFADAVLTYLRLTETELVVEQRLLELDRATLPVDRLAAELARYGRLLRAEDGRGRRVWETRFPSFPPVICVLAGASHAVLERRRDATVAVLAGDPRIEGVSIRLCLAENLTARGPFAPIFTDVADPGQPVDWLVSDEELGR
ncbi:MAG: replication-relaxation family protein [Actinobacteria bacterium]|nr:replication-relaxation family protein [Actinomycetota bacterium]